MIFIFVQCLELNPGLSACLASTPPWNHTPAYESIQTIHIPSEGGCSVPGGTARAVLIHGADKASSYSTSCFQRIHLIYYPWIEDISDIKLVRTDNSFFPLRYITDK